MNNCHFSVKGNKYSDECTKTDIALMKEYVKDSKAYLKLLGLTYDDIRQYFLYLEETGDYIH